SFQYFSNFKNPGIGNKNSLNIGMIHKIPGEVRFHASGVIPMEIERVNRHGRIGFLNIIHKSPFNLFDVLTIIAHARIIHYQHLSTVFPDPIKGQLACYETAVVDMWPDIRDIILSGDVGIDIDEWNTGLSEFLG